MNSNTEDFRRMLTTEKYCMNRVVYYHDIIQGNLMNIRNNHLTYNQARGLIESTKKIYYKLVSVIEYAKIEFPSFIWCVPVNYNDLLILENEIKSKGIS